MNRARSREVAMELLYQMDIHQAFLPEKIDAMIEQYGEKLDIVYIKNIVETFLINQPKVDDIILTHLKGWKIERIGKVDLAILRIAITEINWLDDIPTKVSINEAINLGKKFVDEKSGKFINGLLGRLVEEAE